jgi:hypothetical protein
MNVVSREFLTLRRVAKNNRPQPAVLRPRFLPCLLLLGLTPTPYAEQSPSPQRTASISGTVLNINEGPVPGAQIALEPQTGIAAQVATADTAGSFSFSNLPAGIFKVKITAPGLEPFESYEITVHDGEKYQLPRIALPIATEKVQLNVTVTEEQLAEEQVDAQIRQRVFGIFPNFYTSFIWNAAPLKPRQKFRLAFRSATDIDSFFNAGILAAVQQANNSYPGYGQGAQGYGKRYGADYADLFAGHMIGGAILPSLFHQDPRYFYQGTGTVRSRAWHAISSSFLCRGDNGRRQFNYSHILGNLAAGAISNLYRPDEDRGAVLVIDNALLHTAALAGANLAREFVFRSITTKVPTYGKGKPQPLANPPSEP